MYSYSENGGSRVEAVIFDWDDTLVENYGAIQNLYRNMIAQMSKRHDLKIQPEEYIYKESYRGITGKDLCISMFGELADEAFDILQAERKKFTSSSHVPSQVEGAEETLKDLKAQGIKVAIVSDRPAQEIEKQFKEVFGNRIGKIPIHGDAKKPDPTVIRKALRRVGVAPEAALYVGDKIKDVEAAIAAGVHPVLVSKNIPESERERVSSM